MVPAVYMPCVYIATNKANGSIYIGKTILGLPARVKRHISAANNFGQQPFCRAIRKHGENSFVWDVLYISESEEALFDAEISLIAAYKAAGFRLYNATEGGPGVKRKPFPSRTRAIKKRVTSQAAKERLSALWTPERKAKQAEIMRKRVMTLETRAKLSAARTGMKFTPEHCEAIRRSKLGNKHRAKGRLSQCPG